MEPKSMANKVFKITAHPKFSLVLMCIISGAYICGYNLISKILFIIIALFVSLLSIIKCIKNKKFNVILYIFEAVCTLLYCCFYVFFYSKFTETGTINFIFILCSILLLLPFAFEIGLSESNKYKNIEGD